MVVRLNALFSCLQEDSNSFLADNGLRSLAELPLLPIEELHPQEMAVLSLSKSLLRKLRPDSSSALDTVALEKFLALNSEQDNWDRRRGEELFDSELLGYFREEMHRFFEPHNRGPLVSSFEQFFARGYFGPGASLGSLASDLYTKVGSSDQTATSPIFFRMYRSYTASHPGWRSAEFLRTAARFDDRVVAGNKLSFVPKNVDTSRTICIEPSLNMFAQLGFAAVLSDRLKDLYSIDLSTQPDINRELARQGSLSGNLCTIDLESASDTISLRMIEQNLPSDVVRWLKLLRSPVCETPRGQVELRMVSTMGNGFTFPLQTAIFSSVVLAAKRFLGRPRTRAGTDWSVFGDDIITHRTDVGAVLSLLRILGFTVNPLKSFFEGPFRESCGSDYFRGQDVRGVYIKSLQTRQDRYVAINRLNDWSAIHGVSLPRTIRLLLSTVPYNRVPVWEADTAGIRVTSRQALDLKRGSKWLYRRDEFRPSVLRFDEGIVRVPRGGKRRFYNVGALYLALLNGSFERGVISVRHNAKSYQTRTRRTLNWDKPSPTLIAGVGIVLPPERVGSTGPRRESAEITNLPA